MNATEIKNLQAAIELKVFGKKLYSKKRGEYTWFYFKAGDLDAREKQRYTEVSWADYNPMKHVLPDNQPRSFAYDAKDAMELLKKCSEIYTVTVEFFCHKSTGGRPQWMISRFHPDDDHLDCFSCADTIELAITLFAKKVFQL